jgi:hypothetical protein
VKVSLNMRLVDLCVAQSANLRHISDPGRGLNAI